MTEAEIDVDILQELIETLFTSFVDVIIGVLGSLFWTFADNTWLTDNMPYIFFLIILFGGWIVHRKMLTGGY
jgi:hypothetical protein